MDESYAHRIAQATQGQDTSREIAKAHEADGWFGCGSRHKAWDRPGAPALSPDRGLNGSAIGALAIADSARRLVLRLAAGQQRAHHRAENRWGGRSWNTPRKQRRHVSKSSRPRSIDWRQRDGNRTDGRRVLGVCDRCEAVRHV